MFKTLNSDIDVHVMANTQGLRVANLARESTALHGVGVQTWPINAASNSI